jgi:hypothetical protein
MILMQRRRAFDNVATGIILAAGNGKQEVIISDQ